MSQSRENWEPADIARLQVGDSIRIDHRWFDHPFPRRMFRISSDKEIAVMRELALTRVFVERRPPQAAPPSVTATATETEAEAEAKPTAEAPVEPAADRAAQRAGLEAAAARERFTQERAQEMLGMLTAGEPGSAAAMVEFVDLLVAILNNSTAPLAPMAPASLGRSMTRVALLGSDAVWLAATIGKRMRLPKDSLRALTTAAAAHAAGLTRMPPYLMDEEPGEQFTGDSTFRTYPVLSARILKDCGGFSDEVVRIVLEHRERPDGSGFPRGLKGDAIHPLAKIIGAVREVQMRSASGHVSSAMALAANYRMIKEVFGAEIANHLASSLLIFPVGTYVQLSDDSVARILRINESARLSPVVESYGPNATLAAPETIDLSSSPGLTIVRVLDTSHLPPRMFETARASRASSLPPAEGAAKRSPDVQAAAQPEAAA